MAFSGSDDCYVVSIAGDVDLLPRFTFFRIYFLSSLVLAVSTSTSTCSPSVLALRTCRIYDDSWEHAAVLYLT